MPKTYKTEFKKLGKKIKELRESKKMTQQTLSDLCDIDIRSIQRIEIGEQQLGVHILFAIADAFKIKASELIDL